MFTQFSLDTNCWHWQIHKNMNSLHIIKLQHFKHQTVSIYEGDRSRIIIQLLTWSTVTNSSDFGILNPSSNHSEVYIHIDDIHTNTHLPAADRWKCIAQTCIEATTYWRHTVCSLRLHFNCQLMNSLLSS